MNIERIAEFITNHPILVGALLVSVGVIISGELKRRLGNGIDVSEMIKLINNSDAQVIDLRDEKAFSAGHIIDSRNILPAKIDSDFSTLKLKVDKPVILVCQMGSTSGGLVKKFIDQGCEQVYSLRDGIYGWEKAKLPLET